MYILCEFQFKLGLFVNIKVCGSKGLPLPPNCGGGKAYAAIAKRVDGQEVPLTLKD